jgi:hypothetical protein
MSDERRSFLSVVASGVNDLGVAQCETKERERHRRNREASRVEIAPGHLVMVLQGIQNSRRRTVSKSTYLRRPNRYTGDAAFFSWTHPPAYGSRPLLVHFNLKLVYPPHAAVRSGSGDWGTHGTGQSRSSKFGE